MTPRNQNILATLNILVLVFRAQKQMIPVLSEEQQHILKITQEHLVSANLTPAVFINTLKELDTKGYLSALSVFEHKGHAEIMRLLDDEQFSIIAKELEKIDTSEFMEKIKIAGADMLEATAPANIHIDRDEILNDSISFKELFESSVEIHKGYTPDVVSTIVLSPFRSIERLLEKMNSGVVFDEVKDAGVWYDPEAYELHFDETTISTVYQSKPTKAHFALKRLFGEFGSTIIYYDDIPESEWQKEEKTEDKSYRDSLDRLIKKHPRLAQLFTVHADHLAIHETYLEHPH